MSKNAFLRAISLFLGMLLCLAPIPAAFAQIEDVEGSNSGRSNNLVNDKIIIHEINPSDNYLYLQQGENDSFTVSFKNNGKKALDIEPKVVAVPYSDRDFDESWITISPANVTVGPGAEQEFTIEVSIPEDADDGYYETYITFTDDVYSEGDPYPQYVNAMYLSISVPIITHEINPSDNYLYLQQGQSDSFTVSFKNNGKKALDIEPKVVAVPYNDRDFDESWITISPANVTVDPSAEQEFTIEVSIPEDADGGDYQTYIAFTDDVYSEGDPYPQYVNAMYLSISVPIFPKLELQTSFIDDTIEAGKEYEYTVKIKNVAAKNITINPEVNRYYSFDEFGLDYDEIEITAPSTLEPGQIADMVIRVPVPENATGTYNGYIEMDVNGNENAGYEPQLELYLTVLQQPTVPYVKTFSTRAADPITIEVSAYASGSNAWSRSPPKDEVPSFELNMKYNSSPVNMTLVKTKQSSNVNIAGDYFSSFSIEEGGIYQNSGSYYTETYTVPGAIGDWELEILPKNTGYFDYSITIGDSE